MRTSIPGHATILQPGRYGLATTTTVVNVKGYSRATVTTTGSSRTTVTGTGSSRAGVT